MPVSTEDGHRHREAVAVDPTESERIRWAVYAAVLAALGTEHPRRFIVARALDALVAKL